MKIVFYASLKPREIMLAKALQDGARQLGDKLEIRNSADYGETDDEEDLKYPGPTDDTDVAVVFGVKGKSRWILEDHLQVGKSTLFMDKGYTRERGEGRHTLYTRISINGPNPNHYFMDIDRPPKRFERLRVNPKERRERTGGTILLCVSSLKYHRFHKLDDPDVYSERIVQRIARLTDRHIIYRPKPSTKRVQSIPGTSMSNGKTRISDALKSCHVLITHGSAAAMDAILAGVPAIVLGGSIARPISETILENVEEPFWPERDAILKWGYKMAYCQWTTEELRSGEAWTDLKKEIQRQAKQKM